MKYKTFENKVISLDEMDHQHLSNIYWFQTIVNQIKCTSNIMSQLINRFDGEILPYRPKPNFKMEIDRLDEMGLLSWRKVGTADVADIVYQGEIVGEACYIDDKRQLLIENIIKNG